MAKNTSNTTERANKYFVDNTGELGDLFITDGCEYVSSGKACQLMADFAEEVYRKELDEQEEEICDRNYLIAEMIEALGEKHDLSQKALGTIDGLGIKAELKKLQREKEELIKDTEALSKRISTISKESEEVTLIAIHLATGLKYGSAQSKYYLKEAQKKLTQNKYRIVTGKQC